MAVTEEDVTPMIQGGGKKGVKVKGTL